MTLQNFVKSAAQNGLTALLRKIWSGLSYIAMAKEDILLYHIRLSEDLQDKLTTRKGPGEEYTLCPQ